MAPPATAATTAAPSALHASARQSADGPVAVQLRSLSSAAVAWSPRQIAPPHAAAYTVSPLADDASAVHARLPAPAASLQLRLGVPLATKREPSLAVVYTAFAPSTGAERKIASSRAAPARCRPSSDEATAVHAFRPPTVPSELSSHVTPPSADVYSEPPSATSGLVAVDATRRKPSADEAIAVQDFDGRNASHAGAGSYCASWCAARNASIAHVQLLNLGCVCSSPSCVSPADAADKFSPPPARFAIFAPAASRCPTRPPARCRSRSSRRPSSRQRPTSAAVAISPIDANEPVGSQGATLSYTASATVEPDAAEHVKLLRTARNNFHVLKDVSEQLTLSATGYGTRTCPCRTAPTRRCACCPTSRWRRSRSAQSSTGAAWCRTSG